MSVTRGTYTDDRYREPVNFTVLDSTEPWIGAVYIAPADRPDVECEFGGPDFSRCTRDELREWAEAIITALDNT